MTYNVYLVGVHNDNWKGADTYMYYTYFQQLTVQLLLVKTRLTSTRRINTVVFVRCCHLQTRLLGGLIISVKD